MDPCFQKDDIEKLGALLRDGPFGVWTVSRERHKVKDLVRFKPSQRQIYLFQRGIVFCKIRGEPGDEGSSPRYSFKKCLKVRGCGARPSGQEVVMKVGKAVTAPYPHSGG